jgi:trimethylamine-N-oxide reductase cytochrome c-type subunit TorC
MKKSFLLISLLFLFTSLHAKVQYVEKTIQAYSNQADTKLSGKILTTTPLEVLKVEGDKALAKITGWNQGSLKRIVYFSKGTRIISAAFSKKAQYEYKVLETDATGKEPWHKVEIITWIENKNLIDDIEVLFAKAKNILETNCGLCHAAHPTHEFSANQWPAVIKGMAPRTPLTKDEILLISQYAQKHSKD